eukprot:Rmarinus@m.8852
MAFFRKKDDKQKAPITQDSGFREIVDSLVDQEILLALEPYQNIWDSLDNPDNLSYFASVLVRKLNTLEKSKDKILDPLRKKISLPPNADLKAILRQSLLSTLLYLSLFYNVPESEDIKVSVSKWNKNHRGKYPYVDKMVDDLTILKSQDFVSEVMHTCISAVCRRGMAPPYPVETDGNAYLYALHYYFTRRCMESTENRPVLFSAIMESLREVAETFDESRFLCLLRLLKVFVTEYPLKSGQLRAAESKLQSFVVWPEPYAGVAKTMLQQVRRERSRPGSLLRERLERENPSLKNHAAISTQNRLIHVVFNPESFYANEFRSLTRQERPFLDNSPLAPMAAIILRVLLSELDIEKGVLRSLEECPVDVMVRTYNELQVILDETSNVDDMNQMDDRHRRLSQLWERLQRDAVIAKTLVNSLGGAGGDAGKGGGAGSGSEGSPQLVRRRSSVARVIDGVFGRRRASMATSLQACGVRLGQSPCNLEFMLHEVNDSVPRAAEVVMEIIERGTAGIDIYSLKEKHPVCVGVAGGEGTLHTFVCGYAEAMKDRPELLDHVDVRVYLYPFGTENSLAQFLGQYCAWYGRHVLSLSALTCPTMPSLCPNAEKDALSNATPGSRPLPFRSPVYFTRMALQEYYREAHEACPVVIRCCTAWTDGSPGNKPSFTLPFLHRAEVSTRGAASDTNRLRVKYYQTDLRGIERRLPVEDAFSSSVIVFTAVPKNDEPSICASPLASNLEMLVQDGDWARRKRTGSNPTVHVASAEVEGMNGFQFSVNVDGRTHGPFTKMRLGPYKWNDTDKTPATINFMTFFPVCV